MQTESALEIPEEMRTAVAKIQRDYRCSIEQACEALEIACRRKHGDDEAFMATLKVYLAVLVAESETANAN